MSLTLETSLTGVISVETTFFATLLCIFAAIFVTVFSNGGNHRISVRYTDLI